VWESFPLPCPVPFKLKMPMENVPFADNSLIKADDFP
jgi:hypothetical protein